MTTSTPFKDHINALLQQRKFAEAYSLLKRAVVQVPDDTDLLANLGWAALQLKKFDDAIDAYQRATDLAPDSDWAWRQLANALLAAERLDEAEEALDTAESLAPDSPWLWRHYATLRRLRDDTDAEIASLLRLEELGAADGNDLNRLGIAYHSQKDYWKAVEYYRRSARNSPDAAAFYNMGLVFISPEVSQDVDATDAYRRALHLTPGYGPAKTNLEAAAPRLAALAAQVKPLAASLLGPQEWFQYYLNPFEVLELVPVDQWLDGEIKIRGIQRAKTRLLQEIELNDGRVGWLGDQVLDRSRAIAIDTELQNPLTANLHAEIAMDEPLLAFLSRGDVTHFLYCAEDFPEESLNRLDSDPAFPALISKPFAQQYDAVLSRALDRKLLSVIEALFDGRRWVLPKDEDTCYQGARRRVRAMVESLREQEIFAKQRKPVLAELEALLEERAIVAIMNLLPVAFRPEQAATVSALRSLAVTCWNVHEDVDLAEGVLRMCDRFSFKSAELTSMLQQDRQTVRDLVAAERAHEARLCFSDRVVAVTRKGVQERFETRETAPPPIDSPEFDAWLESLVDAPPGSPAPCDSSVEVEVVGRADHSIPAASVTGLRWGITAHSGQGAHTYEFCFQATDGEDNAIEAVWTVSEDGREGSTNLFRSLIDAAVRYLVPGVVARMQAQLASGATMRLGLCTLSSDGITYDCPGSLMCRAVTIPWQDLDTKLEEGSVVLFSASRPNLARALPMRGTYNAVVMPFLCEARKEQLGELPFPVSLGSDQAAPAVAQVALRVQPRALWYSAIALAATYIVFFSGVFDRRTPGSSSAPSYAPRPVVRQPVPDRPPVRLSAGAAPFGSGLFHGNSTLLVDNGTPTDAVVRLVRTSGHRVHVRNFYIPASNSFTAPSVPPGDYVIRVAFGMDWDVASRSFRERRSFTESEPFEITERSWREETDEGYTDHTEASKMSITLHQVQGGNFSTSGISEDDFMR